MPKIDLIDRELEELTNLKARSFLFHDNIRRKVTLLEVYWRWHDRILESGEAGWTEEEFLFEALAESELSGMSLDETFRVYIANTVAEFDRCGVNLAMSKEERSMARRQRERMDEAFAFSRKRCKQMEAVRRNLGLDG